MKQRAIQAGDKQERLEAILDATARLLLRSRDRSANVADVAEEANLAKGTVYLYFPSKEDLFLALHERNVDAFFEPLMAMLDADAKVDFDRIFALIRSAIVEAPLFLPLATRCLGMMDQHLLSGAASAFMTRMGERLRRAGGGLERHFVHLRPGDGAALLRHSYALILGLWQMAGGANATQAPRGDDKLRSAPCDDSAGQWGYEAELERSLRALWAGAFQVSAAAGVH